MSLDLDFTELGSLMQGVGSVCATPRGREPLRKALEVAVGEMGQALAQGQSPDGTPHPALSPRTIRKRKNKQGPPLIDQGDLLLSLIGDGSGHIEEVTDEEATLGTIHNKNGSNPPIAVVHQLGSTKRRIPARPFIGVNDAIADATADLVADHVIHEIAAL